MENRKRQRMFLIAGVALLALALLLNLLINLNLTLYSDDYQYGTFFRDGVRGFIRNTIDHYQETNGRWFVHILIPIFLLADVHAFALVSPLLTAGIFLLGASVQNRHLSPGAWLSAAGLGMLILLGSDIFYLRMSLYWLAAYFNYAFPLIFPLATVAFMLRGMEKGLSGWGKMGLWVCAFLAGACTEQNAVIAIILVFGCWLLKGWGRLRTWCLPPVFTALGALTILLAPGSRARMDRGVEGGLLSVFQPGVFIRRYFEVMDYLSGNWFWNLLFAALCLILALLCLFHRELPRFLLSGFVAGPVAVVLAAAGLEKILAVFTVAYTLYLAVTLLFVREYQLTGLMLLGGGASVMMLTVTTLFYARTFFPCIMLFVLVTVSLLFRLLEDIPPLPCALACGVLTAVFVVRWAPMYAGYVANHQVIERNLAAIEAGRGQDEIVLDMDLNWRYRYSMCFDGSFFLSNFRKYYRIPAETHIRFSSEEFQLSDLRLGDELCSFPVLERKGERLFPIDFVFREAGVKYSFDWSDYNYRIWLDENEYILYRDGRLMEQTPQGEMLVDDDCLARRPYSDAYNLQFMREEDLKRCFKIEFDYNQEKNVFSVKH